MNPNVFNKSGALTDLFKNIKEKSIFGFNSVDEIIEYKKNHQSEIEKIKTNKLNEVLHEIELLEKTYNNLVNEYENKKNEQILKMNSEIDQLKILINKLDNKLINKIKKYFIKKKTEKYELKYDYYIELSLKKYAQENIDVENKILYLKNNRNHEVEKRASDLIKNIEHTVFVINDNSSLIYGSIGEIRAIELLKQLPEQYYIINDVRKIFDPPIYNRNENDRIYSIQLDHMVIGPTGIFIIETKYWSQKSIENKYLYSPIKQLNRSSYALFVLLNGMIKDKKVAVFSNNWGQFKISISNILLMLNTSTDQQFQFVKLLTKDNLINYITKGRVIFNEEQIRYLVRTLK
jgi:hypothetical protein